MKGTVIFYISIVTLSLLLSVIIIVPIASMVFSVNVVELYAAITDQEIIRSLLLTFECAMYATVIAVMLGIPLAYIFAYIEFPLKRFIITLFDIPMIIPHTASGIALLFVFGSGKIGSMLHSAGIEFVGAKTGIVIAMTFVAIPYFINAVHNGFASIDARLINVARTLGATKSQCFVHVIVPLSFRAIVTGALMMWARGISEFGAVVIIAYHPMIAPVLLYDRFTAYGLKGSHPVAALLIIFCIIFFVILRVALTYREKHAYSP
ncbi:MAG: ABC transporter permease [Spirochaetes bacterium]|nr:ABC transporter permease [Spirochaetota bacterium]